jgi:hypothetical protein
MYLLAITPPGNIEVLLQEQRSEIYSKTGEASALALPPLIPVAWYTSEPAIEKKLLKIEGPRRIDLGTRVPFKNGLYREMKDRTLWDQAAVQLPGPSCRNIPFAPFPGIFMAGRNKNISLPENPVSLGWKAKSLSCYQIEWKTEIWCENLVWKEIWSIPIKSFYHDIHTVSA